MVLDLSRVASPGSQNSVVYGAPLGIHPLSPREKDILALVAEGYSNKRIAWELGIAERTVKHYLTLAMGKLQATDRTHAVVTAARLGWIDIYGTSSPQRGSMSQSALRV